MQLNFHSESHGDVFVLSLDTDALDIQSAPELKRQVVNTVQEHPACVLDLSRLRFIDSSAIGALLTGLKAANAAGGDLKLCCVHRQVQVVLELVRLHHVFSILPTVDEAVAAFAHG